MTLMEVNMTTKIVSANSKNNNKQFKRDNNYKNTLHKAQVLKPQLKFKHQFFFLINEQSG